MKILFFYNQIPNNFEGNLNLNLIILKHFRIPFCIVGILLLLFYVPTNAFEHFCGGDSLITIGKISTLKTGFVNLNLNLN